MGSRRVIWIAIAAAVAFICIGFIGVRTFVQAVYDGRDCDWANIDNIEMHARVDIPEIENCDCSYTVSDNVKRAVFTIDQNQDLEEYVRSQKLRAMPTQADQPSAGQGFDKNRIYIREDSHEDSRYRLALDPASRKLWVQITYKR